MSKLTVRVREQPKGRLGWARGMGPGTNLNMDSSIILRARAGLIVRGRTERNVMIVLCNVGILLRHGHR